MEFWRVKYAHKYTSTIPQKPRLESAYRHTFARRGRRWSRTTIATFEGSRSFGEIARASYPSFASSRREGVVLRLGQPWVNPGLTCRRRAIVWTLSPPCFACLLASASARPVSETTIARVGARTRARASIAAHIDSKEFVPAFFPSFSCLASRARDARGAARGGIRRRETPLQRAPSRASARRARRGAALERRAVRCSTFFLLSRRVRDDRAESRARRRVPRCPRARPRRASQGRDAETKRHMEA